MDFKQMMTRLRANAEALWPDRYREWQSAETRQVAGLRSEARVRDLVMTIDEPRSFGGTDSAPNPAEVALAALGASLEVTCRVYAAYLDVPLDEIRVSVTGALDVRGFLQLDETVRSGFTGITAHMAVRSTASRSQLDRLLEAVERSCPVLDLYRRPTPVTLTLNQGS